VHRLERAAGGQLPPPADAKAIRDVIRYRAKIAQQPVSEITRLGNVPQDVGQPPISPGSG